MGSESDTVEDAEGYSYLPLTLGFQNLSDLVGSDTHYIWIRIPFTLTEDLSEQALGFVVPYVHFSERTWLNGYSVGQMGGFGENAYSSLFASYCYFLPQDLLKTDGENVIYMKVLSQGRASVGKGLFITEYDLAKRAASYLNFFHAKVYLFFDGILACAFAFLFILFLANKKDLAILNFSLLCASAAFFLLYFFASELPSYSSGFVNHFTFVKLFLCCTTYTSIFLVISFILAFLKYKIPVWLVVLRHFFLYVTVIITLAAPDFNSLMKLCMPMLIFYTLQFFAAEVMAIKALFNALKRRRSIIYHIGFLPILISMFFDIVIRDVLRDVSSPYFTLFGFLLTIAFFIVYISAKYNKIYLKNEQLNRDLKQEVNKQTVGLRVANNRLTQELDRAEKNLTMAAIVQQKFFVKPQMVLSGWDIAMDYYPLSKVSGDLYDFFISGNNLDGLAVFDASGHGVAAALVTMLSKNIIQQAFNNSLIKMTKLSKAMEEVNDTFIDEKGEVENYLTGLMLRMNNINDSVCSVEMSVAGHPYPVYYSGEKGEIVSLEKLVEGKHYGAVGMAEMMVNYADVTFEMKKDDILLCFTDGITEIQNENQDEFGRKRIEEIVKKNHQASSTEILGILSDAVSDFRGSIPREDDITAIVLKKN